MGSQDVNVMKMWSTVERSDHVSEFWSTRRQSQPQSSQV